MTQKNDAMPFFWLTKNAEQLRVLAGHLPRDTCLIFVDEKTCACGERGSRGGEQKHDELDRRAEISNRPGIMRINHWPIRSRFLRNSRIAVVTRHVTADANVSVSASGRRTRGVYVRYRLSKYLPISIDGKATARRDEEATVTGK